MKERKQAESGFSLFLDSVAARENKLSYYSAKHVENNLISNTLWIMKKEVKPKSESNDFNSIWKNKLNGDRHVGHTNKPHSFLKKTWTKIWKLRS